MKSMKINPEMLDEKKYDENVIKEAAETILEADDIKKNKELMTRVKDYLKKKKKQINTLEDLKRVAGTYSGGETEDLEDA